MSDLITISEVYGPVLAGEGTIMGLPTVFVRVGGCDYRCSWCDTSHAVLPQYKDEWRRMSPAEIWAVVARLSAYQPLLVSLSGGNPALYDLAKLIDLGHLYGYTFNLETQGSVPKDWFSTLDYLTLSPKGPSSGMTTDLVVLDRCVQAGGPTTQTSLKVVVFDDDDYDFAKEIAARYPERPMVLQVGNPAAGPGDFVTSATLLNALGALQARVLADRWYGVRVLPQLHTLLFGNRRGT